jgi:thioredoxin 1
MASDKVVHISDSEFDNMINKPVPCLVDFWAPWCGPCVAIAPVLDELAAEFDGQAIIAKMNVDDNPATVGKFSIRSIPTLILFKNGDVVDTMIGNHGKAQLQALIQKAI